MNRGERVWLDDEPCIVLLGWGEGRPGLIASVRRLSDGQRFLWLAPDGFVAVSG